MKNKLNIQSIFDSLDGEVNGFNGAGELCTFIRLKGCNFFPNGCSYCDTKYAQNPKPTNWMTIDEIVEHVHFPKVTITGGEALMQKVGVVSLIRALRRRNDFDNINVSVETNGSIPIPFGEASYCCFIGDDKHVRWVVDYKLKNSEREDKMDLSVFSSLRDIDVIKFVISDKEDYKRACSLIKKHSKWVAKKVFSPVVKIRRGVRVDTKFKSEKLNRFLPIFVPFEFVDPEWPCQLVTMMMKDKVPAQFSLQLHKILWPGAKEER